MIVWLFRHYKAVVAFMGLGITAILTPGVIFIFNFFIDSKASQANVKIHDAKIIKLEESVYRADEKFQAIKDSLIRIEEREYRELRQARQERLKNKKEEL